MLEHGAGGMGHGVKDEGFRDRIYEFRVPFSVFRVSLNQISNSIAPKLILFISAFNSEPHAPCPQPYTLKPETLALDYTHSGTR